MKRITIMTDDQTAAIIVALIVDKAVDFRCELLPEPPGAAPAKKKERDTAPQKMELQLLERFRNAGFFDEPSVEKFLVELGYNARSSSSALSRLVSAGYLSREGVRGLRQYKVIK